GAHGIKLVSRRHRTSTRPADGTRPRSAPAGCSGKKMRVQKPENPCSERKGDGEGWGRQTPRRSKPHTARSVSSVRGGPGVGTTRGTIFRIFQKYSGPGAGAASGGPPWDSPGDRSQTL